MSKRELKPGEIRRVQDDINEQHQKMKDMPLKEKLSYFWLYYKYHTLATIAGLIIVISMIVNVVTAKDYGFYGIMLNAVSLSNTDMEESFIAYAQLNPDEYDYFIDTDSTLSYHTTSEYDMATAQRLIAITQTGDLDAVVIDSEVYNNYAYNEMFLNLSQVLSPDDIAKYEPYFYYVDNAEIVAAYEDSNYINPNLIVADNTGKFDMEVILAEAELHRHPENMKDPIPVGIFIDESPFALKSEAYSPLVPIYGIAVTSQRVDTAIEYLHFLWDDSIDFTQMYKEF